LVREAAEIGTRTDAAHAQRETRVEGRSSRRTRRYAAAAALQLMCAKSAGSGEGPAPGSLSARPARTHTNQRADRSGQRQIQNQRQIQSQ
jgi:hypothetical protein